MAFNEQNLRRKITLGNENNALTWLIIINAVIFVALLFIQVVYLLGYDTKQAALSAFDTQVSDWFQLPGDGKKLLTRPWTILLYMFSQTNGWYLISSLFWIWCFGYILQDLTGNNKIIPIYIYGGLFGALAFLLSANLIPGLRDGLVYLSLMGAGASVMALAVATTVLRPGYKVFPLINGGIPVWIITLIYVAIDLATIAMQNSAVAIAHICGGLAGFVFIKQLHRGNDWGAWMHSFYSWINDLFNPDKQLKKQQPQRVYYKTGGRKAFERKPHVTQQRLDEILDKINVQGYHFLTDEEKEFLKKASKEDI